MISHHLRGVVRQRPRTCWQRAEALAAQARYELVAFLTDVMGVTETVPARFDGVATYHDSCSGLRELGVQATTPRPARGTVPGLELREMADPEVCCGFGGTFCVKYPEISTRMVSDQQADDIIATGADTAARRGPRLPAEHGRPLVPRGQPVAVRHVAEVLAGMTNEVSPIGMPRLR